MTGCDPEARRSRCLTVALSEMTIGAAAGKPVAGGPIRLAGRRCEGNGNGEKNDVAMIAEH